jgi:hypothetical protein
MAVGPKVSFDDTDHVSWELGISLLAEMGPVMGSTLANERKH